MIYSKESETKKVNDLHDECGIFWAFSNEQFKEGAEKHPLKEGEKYLSIGMGGYMPKSNFDKFLSGMKEIDIWAKTSKKDDKKVIEYELNNYECFYQGDIEDAMPRLKHLGYTRKQVQKVFNQLKERRT